MYKDQDSVIAQIYTECFLSAQHRYGCSGHGSDKMGKLPDLERGEGGTDT